MPSALAPIADAATTLRSCKLTVDGQADAASVAGIVRDVLAALPADADDERKVLALYHWLREKLFVYPSSPDDLHEDCNKATQLINWWGYGLCGTQSKVFAMLLKYAIGFENVRLIGMREREVGSWRMRERGYRAFYWSGQARDNQSHTPDGHCSLEVYWDGAWHLLDVMVGFYRRRADGVIASLDELLADPSIVDTPTGDPEADMPFGDEREIFTDSAVNWRSVPMNFWAGEELPLALRPGESFTWLAEPVPGAYYLHPRIRARFGSDALAPGPRGHRPDRPQRRYGNGEHRWRVSLRPDPSDPFWCAETADWHLPVELPYPIIAIEWRMDEGGEGFLLFEPSGEDRIQPIQAIGRQFTREDRRPARHYTLIVRSPGRLTEARPRPITVDLRTLVQLNPAATPRLRAGGNTLRLHGDGDGQLCARVRYRVGDAEREQELRGVGAHEVACDGEPEAQELRLANEEQA